MDHVNELPFSRKELDALAWSYSLAICWRWKGNSSWL